MMSLRVRAVVADATASPVPFCNRGSTRIERSGVPPRVSGRPTALYGMTYAARPPNNSRQGAPHALVVTRAPTA